MSVTVVQGSSADLPFQCKVRATHATAVYEATDTLTVAVYAHNSATPLGTPVIGWYAINGQTGYDQGQVMISLAGGDTAALQPATVYTIAATRQLPGGGRSEAIVRQQLIIEAPAI